MVSVMGHCRCIRRESGMSHGVIGNSCSTLLKHVQVVLSRPTVHARQDNTVDSVHRRMLSPRLSLRINIKYVTCHRTNTSRSARPNRPSPDLPMSAHLSLSLSPTVHPSPPKFTASGRRQQPAVPLARPRARACLAGMPVGNARLPAWPSPESDRAGAAADGGIPLTTAGVRETDLLPHWRKTGRAPSNSD